MPIVLRLVKGLPLSFMEMDGNWQDLDTRALDLDARADAHDTALNGLGSSVSDLDDALTALDGTVTSIGGTVDSLSGVVSALSGQVGDLDDELGAHETRLDGLDTLFANLDASEVQFNNLASGLTAEDVQAALDEIVTLIGNAGDVTLGTSQTLTAPKRSSIAVANSGSLDFAASANFSVTPAAPITLQFSVSSGNAAGQSGFIKINNPSGHAISVHSNFKIDEDLVSLISTAGSYLLSYFAETNTYANLVSSSALT